MHYYIHKLSYMLYIFKFSPPICVIHCNGYHH